MKILKLSFIALFLIATCGCSFFSSDDSVYTRSKIINENANISGWKKINDSKNADLTFENTKTHSLIALNSNCRKNQFSTLEGLVASILAGVDDVEVFEKKKETLYNRDAIYLKARGGIDGVTRFLGLVVFQKNFCIYDALLISTSEKKLNHDIDDFHNFVESSLKDEKN